MALCHCAYPSIRSVALPTQGGRSNTDSPSSAIAYREANSHRGVFPHSAARQKQKVELCTVGPGREILLLFFAQGIDANAHGAELQFRDPVFYFAGHIINFGCELFLVFDGPFRSERL